jgi:hypothetical protein
MSGDDGEKRFTQADVDRIVQDRVAREKAKYEELEAERDALKEKVAEYEKTSLDSLKTKIATDLKLPPSLAGRLQGANEKELRADGEKLLKEIGPKEPVGGGGNPAGEVKKPLTREAVKAMKPDEIIANMDQIKSQMKEGSLR